MPGHVGPPSSEEMTVLLSTVSSDAHTWNLVYLQLLIEEHGHRVVNLGACVPDDHLIAQVRQIRPDLVVISTVNGHGRIDGERMIRALRAHPDLATVPVVIGGKLTVDGALTRQVCDDLLAAGFDDVFDADADVPRFRTLLRASTLPERVMVP